MVFISNVQSSNYSNILTIVEKFNEMYIIMRISQVCNPKCNHFFTQHFSTSPVFLLGSNHEQLVLFQSTFLLL